MTLQCGRDDGLAGEELAGWWASIKKGSSGSVQGHSSSACPPATWKKGWRECAAVGVGQLWDMVLGVGGLSQGHPCAWAAMRARGAWGGVSRTRPERQRTAGSIPSAWCWSAPVWVPPPASVPSTEETPANWRDFGGRGTILVTDGGAGALGL